jgi:hypothetical protein
MQLAHGLMLIREADHGVGLRLMASGSTPPCARQASACGGGRLRKPHKPIG